MNNETQVSKRLLRFSDFTERYSTSRSTAYREMKAGRLKSTKLGRRTMIAIDDAEAWLAQLRLKGRSAA